MHLGNDVGTLDDPSVDLHESSRSPRTGAAAPCRVLIVDDDELIRARLASLLSLSGYAVEVAASGAQALDILRAAPCQIVLTDWQMPDLDGLTLCRHVRTGCKDNYVYIIMLTVRDSKQDVLVGLGAGADDYVVKGAPVEEILARIETGRRITGVERSLRISDRENHRLAVTDALTGIYNLRYLMKYLPREVARSQRYRRPLSLLSCDIDRFKQVNDRFGHAAGDLVLQAFASRSSSCLRGASDWVARTGGDEFMIVLPETTSAGAHTVARKLRHLLAASPVQTNAGAVAFMASIGVTTIQANSDSSPASVRALLRRADRNMYADKRGSRGID